MVLRFIKLKWLLLCISVTFVMTGCWNNRDIAEMSFAVAIGIDKAENDQIEITVQIAKPSAMKLAGSGEGGTGGKEAAWVYSAKGDTVFDAIRNSYTSVKGRLFINHIQLIVIGEELAKESIVDNFDFFERESEFNIKALVLIAKGLTAKEVLNAHTELGNLPVTHIKDVIKNSHVNTTKIKKTILFDVIQEMVRVGIEPIIPVIYSDKEKKESLIVKDLKIEGSGIIKDGRLTGWLNDKETRGALYVLNEVKNTIISISNPNEDKKKISLEVLQSKGQVDFEKRNGSILFRISIRQKVNIGEIQGEIDLTKKDTIKKIEENANQYVENEIREAIEKMQVDYQADVLGFGEIINKKAPGLWKELEGSWDKVFSKIPVEIEVETITTRSGYTQNPPKPK